MSEIPVKKLDLRYTVNNPMAGTGYPHQPKATNPPPHKHLKRLSEHRQGGENNGRETQ